MAKNKGSTTQTPDSPPVKESWVGAKEIVWMTLKQLKPYEKNPRRISEQAVEKVAKSITDFGFNNPILVSSDNSIVAGHTRLRAAYRLALDKVPVIKLALTEVQCRSFRIADNKSSEFTGWDYDILREEMLSLGDLDNFDATSTLFDQDEIDKMLNISPAPTLDQLGDEFGEHDETDGWPIVKIKLSPETKDMWDSTMRAAGVDGDGESIKVDRILHCVDMGALKAYVGPTD